MYSSIIERPSGGHPWLFCGTLSKLSRIIIDNYWPLLFWLNHPPFMDALPAKSPECLYRFIPSYLPGTSAQGETKAVWAAPVPPVALTPSAGAGAQKGFKTNYFHFHHHFVSNIPAQLFICCLLIDIKGFRVYFPAWTLWFWYIAIPACEVKMFKINQTLLMKWGLF